MPPRPADTSNSGTEPNQKLPNQICGRHEAVQPAPKFLPLLTSFAIHRRASHLSQVSGATPIPNPETSLFTSNEVVAGADSGVLSAHAVPMLEV